MIVPVSNNGLWKIGTVTEKIKCKRNEVPYPLNQTKGVAGKAGLFAKGKMKRQKKEQLLREIELEEEMEDLDQYN